MSVERPELSAGDRLRHELIPALSDVDAAKSYKAFFQICDILDQGETLPADIAEPLKSALSEWGEQRRADAANADGIIAGLKSGRYSVE